MLRIFLTGLALSMPLAAMGQEGPDASADAVAPAAKPGDAVAKPPPKPGHVPGAPAPAAATGLDKDAPPPPAKADAAMREPVPPAAPSPAAAKPEAAKPDAATPAAATPGADKPKAAQPEGGKSDPAKPEAKTDMPASDAAKAAAKPAEAPKPPSYLPNLFDVTVIDTWDTLNVRETPDGQAKVIATLPATAKAVELVGRDATGKWGKVNSGEQSGWVALRFLKPQGGVWQQAAVPQSLACSGTEPFWSLRASQSGMVFAEPDQPERALALRKVLDRGIEGEPSRGLIAGDDKGRFTAFIRPAQCSDGMSDRGYALAVSVIIDGQDIPSRMLTGCCSIAR